MRNIKIIKWFIIWLIIWISLFSVWVFASVSWAGILWNLFEIITINTKIWDDEYVWQYRLLWDNIKNNTVDSSEIEDWTVKLEDLWFSFGRCWTEENTCRLWQLSDLEDTASYFKWKCLWSDWWPDVSCAILKTP